MYVGEGLSSLPIQPAPYVAQHVVIQGGYSGRSKFSSPHHSQSIDSRGENMSLSLEAEHLGDEISGAATTTQSGETVHLPVGGRDSIHSIQNSLSQSILSCLSVSNLPPSVFDTSTSVCNLSHPARPASTTYNASSTWSRTSSTSFASLSRVRAV